MPERTAKKKNKPVGDGKKSPKKSTVESAAPRKSAGRKKAAPATEAVAPMAESAKAQAAATESVTTPPSAGAPRTAEQIAVTTLGPRPVPALSAAPTRPQPELQQRVLDNGLSVIAVRKPGTPLVEVRLRVPFGGRAPSHTARAELLAATLLFGTTRRSREQVDAELALVGGHLDAGVDPQRLSVSGSVLATGLPDLLDVLADSLLDPAFRRHDVSGERDRLVEQLTVSAAQPSVVARQHLQERRFGNHPAAWEMPDPALVATLGPAALRALHKKGLVPNGSTLVLVGDLDPAGAIDAAERALAGWTSEFTTTALATPPEVTAAAVRAFHRPGAVQSQVRLSAPAYERTHPDYAAAQLANLVYGGYFSSRLVENIREDKGYTYSAHSAVEFWPGRAAVSVAFDTTTPSSAAALLEARYELGRLALVPPKDEEIDAARNYALGTLATSLSTQAGYASTLSSLAGLGLGIEWLRGHPERLTAVTPSEVARVAGTFLAPSAFTGVVVGDLEAIGSGLQAIGGVELP